MPGVGGVPFTIDAVLGEGLFGNVQRFLDDSTWREARSPKGEVYYYHAVTKQTSWTKPQSVIGVPPPPGGRPPVPPPRPGALGLGTPPLGSNPAAIAAHSAILAAQATAAAADTQSANLSSGKVGPVGGNLFVYHIPNSWDDNILRQHFEHFGGILSCRIQKDADGRPRGFGFVSYESAEAGQAAIAGMHGFPVEGKWLKVQLKKGDAEAAAPAGGADIVTPPPPPGGFVPAPPPAPPRPAPY